MIRHILADGREVKSVKGLVIPITGPTAAVYRIVAAFVENHSEIYQKKESGNNATT